MSSSVRWLCTAWRRTGYQELVQQTIPFCFTASEWSKALKRSLNMFPCTKESLIIFNQNWSQSQRITMKYFQCCPKLWAHHGSVCTADPHATVLTPQSASSWATLRDEEVLRAACPAAFSTEIRRSFALVHKPQVLKAHTAMAIAVPIFRCRTWHFRGELRLSKSFDKSTAIIGDQRRYLGCSSYTDCHEEKL